MPEHGDWVRLGEDPPNEFTFGLIGRFWAGTTAFEQIDASAFRSFDSPGYAKISASLSLLRPYGDRRTLLSYEARTQATDETARRAFLRYWTLVSPGVGVVMRSLLALVAQEGPARDSSRPWPSQYGISKRNPMLSLASVAKLMSSRHQP